MNNSSLAPSLEKGDCKCCKTPTPEGNALCVICFFKFVQHRNLDLYQAHIITLRRASHEKLACGICGLFFQYAKKPYIAHCFSCMEEEGKLIHESCCALNLKKTSQINVETQFLIGDLASIVSAYVRHKPNNKKIK